MAITNAVVRDLENGFLLGNRYHGESFEALEDGGIVRLYPVYQKTRVTPLELDIDTLTLQDETGVEVTASSDQEKLDVLNGYVKKIGTNNTGGGGMGDLTENLNANNHRITNLGNAIVEGDALNLRESKLQQIKSNAFNSPSLSFSNAETNRGVSLDSLFNHTFITVNELTTFQDMDNLSILYTTLNIGGEQGFILAYRPNGELLLSVNDGTRHDLALPVSERDIAVIAVVFDEDSASLFVDGILIGSLQGLSNFSFAQSTPLLTTDRSGSSRQFHSLQVWNRSLLDSEILGVALGIVDIDETNAAGDLVVSSFLANSNPSNATSLSSVSVNGFTATTIQGALRGGVIINLGSFNLFGNRGKTVCVSFEYNLNSDETSYFHYSNIFSGILDLENTEGQFVRSEITFTLGENTTPSFNSSSRLAFFINGGDSVLSVRNLNVYQVGQVANFKPEGLGPLVWEGTVNGQTSFIDTSALNVIGDIRSYKAVRTGITQTTTITEGQLAGNRYAVVTLRNNSGTDVDVKVQENSTGSFILGDVSNFVTIPANTEMSFVPASHQLFDVDRDIDIIVDGTGADLDFIGEFVKVR